MEAEDDLDNDTVITGRSRTTFFRGGGIVTELEELEANHV
jgi:hypothetical protein